MGFSSTCTGFYPSTHHGDFNRYNPAPLFVVHSAESGLSASAEDLAHYFATNEEYTSPNYVVTATECLGMVDEDLTAYHCGPNGNGITNGVEQPGRAAFTRAEWLEQGTAQFTNVGNLFADWAKRHGVPTRRATNDDIKYWFNGGSDYSRGGYCDHNQISEAIGKTDHWDVGLAYPWDIFEAAFTAPPTPVPEPPQPIPLPTLEDDVYSIVKLKGRPEVYAAAVGEFVYVKNQAQLTSLRFAKVASDETYEFQTWEGLDALRQVCQANNTTAIAGKPTA